MLHNGPWYGWSLSGRYKLINPQLAYILLCVEMYIRVVKVDIYVYTMHIYTFCYISGRYDVDFSMAWSLTLSTRPQLCGVIMQSDQRVAQFATRTMRIFRSSPDWTDRRVLCLASLIFNPALLSGSDPLPPPLSSVAKFWSRFLVFKCVGGIDRA